MHFLGFVFSLLHLVPETALEEACRGAVVKAAGASSSHHPSARASPGAKALGKHIRHKAPCHNPLLMANFPHKSQEKEFMGSLICPGCTSLLFYTVLVEPSSESAWACHFYPLPRGFRTSPSILEGTRGQESHGRVSCVSPHAAR